MANTSVFESASRLAGRYRLIEPLARGGMGDVWRARDEHVGRLVAVKVLRRDLSGDPANVERFRREARLASQVAHPNVASVIDIVSNPPAIVFEFVDGETLAERLRRGPLPMAVAARLADDLLAALEATHALGIVHRDVTPANVLIACDGCVKVADFGIARDDDAVRLTDTGTVVGTAFYLAPEQLEDRTPDPASDQYAAGLVIYEALTGRRPFEASTPAASAVARLATPPTHVRVHNPDVPVAVASVIMRALERHPGDRHASVAEMRSALAAAAGEPEPTLRHAAAPPPTAPVTAALPTGGLPPPRHPTILGAVRLLIVAAVAFGLAVGAAALTGADRGPVVTVVPDLVGSPIGEGRTALTRAGLRADVSSVDAVEPQGTVIGQDVAPRTRVVEGTLLRIEVSSGAPPCCRAPEVIGLGLGDAAALLSDAGLAMGAVELVESDDVSEGTVLSQTPEPGSAARPDDAVDLEVSSGDKGGGEVRRGRGNGKDDD